MNFLVVTDIENLNMSSELGLLLWNRAVDCAPYDTGNLRRSIVMSKNMPTQKQYIYNAMNALYLDYLEKGEGPVKKHKGFISQKTMSAFITELIYYYKTGRPSSPATIPVIGLTKSKNGPMFHEKRIMKNFGVAWQKVTADDRRKMSRFTYGTKNRLNIEKELITGSQRARIKRDYRIREYDALYREVYKLPSGDERIFR